LKILICGDVDGDLDLLHNIIEDNPKIYMAFCLGNLGIYSKSTPIKKLLREKLRKNVERSIEFNETVLSFPKAVYSLIGSIDDPFLPEIGVINLFRTWGGVQNFAVFDDENTNYVPTPVGMLGGYYSSKYYKFTNNKRTKMKRERKSNLLCKTDFDMLKYPFKYLFTHESPVGDFIDGYGCPDINNLASIRNESCKIIFTGHHRKYFDTFLFSARDRSSIRSMARTRVVGLPALSEGYVIFDMYNENVEYIKTDYNLANQNEVIVND